MADISENNKRIAKNTLVLYFRMILVMAVSLYTSRVIIESLGIEGYGLYTVIGGVVALFAIVSGSLSSAISRFITYELGTGNIIRLKSIFSSSLYLQLFLCGCIIIVFTPISVIFIATKMDIPYGDYQSAYWILGFSVATFCVSLLSVPYNAVIISHENMKLFSYISVIEVSLKLGVAYLVTTFSHNRVIVYAALLFIVGLIVQSFYIVFCRIKYEECKGVFCFNKSILKELGSFAGWNFFGAASGILRTQGNNIILNIFYGTAVNAAYAIAMQVNNAVNQMADNFMVSVNPQITKYYANRDLHEMNKLINRSAKLSFFLTWIIAFLILVNTRYIVEWWLVDVPSDTVIFVQLILICTLSESVSRPLITAMLATGKIRNYQLVVGGLQMLNLPISYIALKLGGSAFWPLTISIIMSQICLGARLYMLRTMIDLNVKSFFKTVYFPSIIVSSISLFLPLIIKMVIKPTDSFMSFTMQSLSYLIWVGFIVYIVGLSRSERYYVEEKIKNRLSRLI